MINPKTPFTIALSALLNRYSLESGSSTPDFILAEYLVGCLENFDKTMAKRSNWYNEPKKEFEQLK